MSGPFVYYHNPRCSKSREGLKLLQEKGIDMRIREYLKEPLSESELLDLFDKLGLSPEEVVRRKEAVYKELGLQDKSLSKEEWASTIKENPILLERPILANDDEAAIGRPPENLLRIAS